MKVKPKSAEVSPELSFEKVPTTARNLYLFQGKKLHLLNPVYPYEDIPVEKKFKSVSELESLVLSNASILFGEQNICGSIPKSWSHFTKWTNVPKHFILCLKDGTHLQFYFLNVIAADQDFFEFVFIKITQLFLILGNKELLWLLAEAIYKEYKKPLQKVFGDQSPLEAIKSSLLKPSAILISEHELTDLLPVKELYPTWQRIHSIVCKRYTSHGNSYCTFTPLFSAIGEVVEKVKAEKVIPTEESHLERVSPKVKEMYLQIKSEVLKFNGALKFNPQRYYIGLSNGRNIAFFHFRKNKIDLVVKCSEKEAKKMLKHFEVRTLKESIQRFWGGTACSIILNDSLHLNEVISLLKKVIGV